MIEYVAWLFVFLGVFFYLTGSIGVVRFPDVFCRLHAVTKSDTLGLGMVLLGLSLLNGSALFAVKAFLIWLVVLMCSAVSASLIGRYAAEHS